MEERTISDLSSEELTQAQSAILTIISLEHKLGDVIDDNDKQTLRDSLEDIDNELKKRNQ